MINPLVVIVAFAFAFNSSAQIFIGISDQQAKAISQKIGKDPVVHRYKDLAELRDYLDYNDINSLLENGHANVVILSDDVPEFSEIAKQQSKDILITSLPLQTKGIALLKVTGLTELERSPIFRALGIRVTEHISPESFRMDLKQKSERVGYIDFRIDSKTWKGLWIPGSAGREELAYLAYLTIEKKYRGKGLSYPLMCAAFKIIKERYGKRYIFLVDRANVKGLYDAMGFRAYQESDREGRWEIGSIDKILASDKCHHAL